ncbi:hypothetical protein B7P43_G14100, partial [Cryptotermes secundus]
RRVTIDTIATAIGCSHGMAYLIMHDRLGFHKVCARWVPRMLNPQHKMQRMGLALQHLNRYHDEGHDMLARTVACDESLVHHYRPETKRASVQWKHPASPAKKSLRRPPGSDSSPKNFMLLVFRGLWNDGTSASMYREIMLKNKSTFQISTLIFLSSISICNLIIALPSYISNKSLQEWLGNIIMLNIPTIVIELSHSLCNFYSRIT